MKKILLALVASFMFFSMNTNAHALSAGVGAGVYIPQGTYADMFDTGYYVNGQVSQGIFLFTDIVARYQYTSADKSPRTLEGHTGELLLKVTPPIPLINVFAAAGAGYTHNTISTSSHSSYNDSGFGYVVEAGAGFSFLILDFGLTASYRYHDLEHFQGPSYGIGAHVNVNIPLL